MDYTIPLLPSVAAATEGGIKPNKVSWYTGKHARPQETVLSKRYSPVQGRLMQTATLR